MKKSSCILFGILVGLCHFAQGSVSILSDKEYKDKEDRETIWGGITNYLRAGILCMGDRSIKVNARSGNMLNSAVLVVGNLSTNITRYYWPTKGPIYALILYDTNGVSALRTPRGQMVAEIPDKNKIISPRESRRQNIKLHPMPPNYNHMWQNFNVSDYFILTNAGTYTLTFDMRIYMRENDGNLRPVFLPRVSIPVECK